jgi:hypothetical protein
MQARVLLLIAALAAWKRPGALQAQDTNHHHESPMMDEETAAGDSLLIRAHLTLTPHWPERPGDRARADSIVRTAREALARYADVAVAERDGFTRFAPKVRRQPVCHYSRRLNALKARWSFDATAPTSLLYRPRPDRGLELVGAMYTAPPGTSLAELDARLPLSIAQWHQHTNLCLAPGTGRLRAAGDLPPSRDPRFGFRGSITTARACRDAGGEFHERVFGWMVHVNFAETGDAVWEHRH